MHRTRVLNVFAILTQACAILSVSGFCSAGGDAPWVGKPCLSLHISCAEPNVKAGDPIPITFVITNDGDTEYVYRDRDFDSSGRMPEYELLGFDHESNALPDPRDQQSGLGGPCGEGKLAPGKSFSKIVDLNLWALVSRPGTYTVKGNYHCHFYFGSDPVAVSAPPISIQIQPRSDAEMAAHIGALSGQLTASKDLESRRGLLRKLSYTCDARALPALIEAAYKRDDASGYAADGIYFYMPYEKSVNDALFKTAMERGVAGYIVHSLKKRGASLELIKSAIAISLSPEHSEAWAQGIVEAHNCPDDSFIPRLIQFAMEPGSKTRVAAIQALAMNRTDESVAKLNKLLTDESKAYPYPGNKESVRQVTEEAIKSAYFCTNGRLFRKDDFPPELQKR